MAKEQMIVFVYDMEYAEDEEYDPINAVLYFYPSWVSVIQKVALCGQLMGISHFLKCCFFRPKIIALQNGKFVFKEFGRFLLAIGTDRNVKDYFLEHRANLFTSLISFFHRDLQTLYNQINTDKYQKNVSERFQHIFGTYLPILQSNENIFQNVPKLRIPKIAGNIFLDAMQTLQSCQQTKGVLGGVILYNNKIIASQLSVSLTKSVVCTYLHRIKSTAETITVNFHIPVGVHMIVVYIPADQYHVLASDAYYYQNLQTQNLSYSAFPVQFQKRKLKKERSIVFTNIPEENNCDQPDAIENVVKTSKTATRPTYLQLRGLPSKTTVPQSNFNSSITEKVDSFTEFPVRPSVCSTPLTENKVLYGNGIMSICANPTESSSFSKIKSLKLVNSFKIDLENIYNSLDDDRKKMERRNSFTDLQDSLKMISKKFFSKQKNSSASTGVSSPDNGDSSCSQIVRAISDPIYPTLNSGEQSYYPLFAKYNDQSSEHEKSKIDIQQFLKDSEVSSNKVTPISDSKLEFAKNIFFGNIQNSENGNHTDTQLHKKSLSLPLKKQYENENKDEINDANEVAFEKNQIPKVPLTPLLAKLSLLELNEKSYDGLSNCNNNTQCRIIAKSGEEQLSCIRKKKDSLTGGSEQHLNDFQKAVLYVCVQQNMTMLLLLEQDSGNKQEIVQAMFDKSVAKLSKMESHLYQTLNVNMMEGVSESIYSLICIDSKWNTLLNVGPWTTLDQTIIEHVHTDLSATHTITDIFLRTNNCTLYTHKSGRTEFFYKESAHFLTGIPPPSDSMGTIGSRAKLRLEKDCSMVVF